jgi:hypothetical protein
LDKNNWIDNIIEECEHVETPRSWLWWSLCCSISAAMANSYFLVTLKGAVIYKANIYVILLGQSGLGKNFPVKLSRQLVSKADVTRVIAGRSSIQAIIKELSLAKSREKKGPISDSRGFVVNGELSTAIIKDPDALTILTDLYDGNDNWVNLLKGDGPEKLKDPYITALFGSSHSHFYESVPQVNIEGGYVGRNIIVEEQKRYKDTDLLDEEESDVDTSSFPFTKFISHLESIGSGGGRIIPSHDAKVLFNDWRRKWRERPNEDKTGFVNRVPDHILKVAMILCCADYDSNLIITEEHIEEAIERVVPLAYTTKRASEGKGTDPLAMQTKMVLDFLLHASGNTLRRKQLLTKGYGNYDSLTLDKIINELHEIGWVKKERVGGGKSWDMEYSLAGEPLEQYRKFMETRGKK